MMPDAREPINEAFAHVYDEYEALSVGNFIDIARRTVIREHIETFLRPGQSILELNAGSGIDAEYFARKNYRVLATDISENAGKFVTAKAAAGNLPNLTFKKCGFDDLDLLAPQQFDYIFSNFGGLNCTGDLEKIFARFDLLLTEGGHASVVVMPKWYPWEMATAFKGNKNAFRRFRKNGVIAHAGGAAFVTHYHQPRKVKNAFPKNFCHIKTQNIGTFYPSAHFSSFGRFGGLLSRLVKFDRWINASPFAIKGIGDYFIITFQKKS
jgi:ubiquinone/menaquinone biosynthesis C-methylase UbiE